MVIMESVEKNKKKKEMRRSKTKRSFNGIWLIIYGPRRTEVLRKAKLWIIFFVTLFFVFVAVAPENWIPHKV